MLCQIGQPYQKFNKLQIFKDANMTVVAIRGRGQSYSIVIEFYHKTIV